MKKNILSAFILSFLLVVGFLLSSIKQPELRSRASASTTLYFSPSSSIPNPIAKRIGDTVLFDVMLTPGSNQLSTLKMHISYDPSYFEASKNAFVVNTSAFPIAIEGPIIRNDDGSIYVTLSVGVDPKQAIGTPVKVGTLALKAIKETSATDSSNNGKIAFEDDTQAFSVAAHDYAYENVIATTMPAYVAVYPGKGSPTVPTKSANPATQNPTGGPTSVPAHATPQATITGVGNTSLITPSAQPTFPTDAAVLSFKVFLHGIGMNDRLDNKTPQRSIRNATITLLNSTNAVAVKRNIDLHYNNHDGAFDGKLILPDLDADNYLIRIKADGYLETQLSGRQNLSISSNEYTMPTVSLITGDVNNDGQLTLLDYNLLLNCASGDQHTCTDQVRALADLDDNGKIDEYDQFIFVKEMQ